MNDPDHDLLIKLESSIGFATSEANNRQTQMMSEIGAVRGLATSLDEKLDRINGTVGRHDLSIQRFSGIPFDGKEANELAMQTRTMWFWFGLMKIAVPITFAGVLSIAGGVITKVWF